MEKACLCTPPPPGPRRGSRAPRWVEAAAQGGRGGRAAPRWRGGEKSGAPRQPVEGVRLPLRRPPPRPITPARPAPAPGQTEGARARSFVKFDSGPNSPRGAPSTAPGQSSRRRRTSGSATVTPRAGGPARWAPVAAPRATLRALDGP
eukprot:scaffold2437_cov395-Prasinococcus_capsulatus_cf.AAC.7